MTKHSTPDVAGSPASRRWAGLLQPAHQSIYHLALTLICTLAFRCQACASVRVDAEREHHPGGAGVATRPMGWAVVGHSCVQPSGKLCGCRKHHAEVAAGHLLPRSVRAAALDDRRTRSGAADLVLDSWAAGGGAGGQSVAHGSAHPGVGHGDHCGRPARPSAGAAGDVTLAAVGAVDGLGLGGGGHGCCLLPCRAPGVRWCDGQSVPYVYRKSIACFRHGNRRPIASDHRADQETSNGK